MKLDRAREHVESLESEVIARSAGEAGADPQNAIVLGLHHKPEYLGYVVRIEQLPDHPFVRWGAIVGDYVHNLRSALDHLAWQLVRTGDAPPNLLDEGSRTRIAFPIVDGDRDAFLASAEARMPGVRYPLLAIAESEQPKARYHFIENSPLRRLRIMSNKDKHEIVTPLGLAVESFPEFSDPDGKGQFPPVVYPQLWTPLERGAPVAFISLSDSAPHPNMAMEGDASFYIALDDGAHASVFLSTMFGAVERILSRFEPFFDSLP